MSYLSRNNSITQNKKAGNFRPLSHQSMQHRRSQLLKQKIKNWDQEENEELYPRSSRKGYSEPQKFKMKRRNSQPSTSHLKQLFKPCPVYKLRKVMKPRGKTFRHDQFTHNLYKTVQNPFETTYQVQADRLNSGSPFQMKKSIPGFSRQKHAAFSRSCYTQKFIPKPMKDNRYEMNKPIFGFHLPGGGKTKKYYIDQQKIKNQKLNEDYRNRFCKGHSQSHADLPVIKDDDSIYSQCIGYLAKVKEQQKILKQKEEKIQQILQRVGQSKQSKKERKTEKKEEEVKPEQTEELVVVEPEGVDQDMFVEEKHVGFQAQQQDGENEEEQAEQKERQQIELKLEGYIKKMETKEQTAEEEPVPRETVDNQVATIVGNFKAREEEEEVKKKLSPDQIDKLMEGMSDLSVSEIDNNEYTEEVANIEGIQGQVTGKYNKLFESNEKYFKEIKDRDLWKKRGNYGLSPWCALRLRSNQDKSSYVQEFQKKEKIKSQYIHNDFYDTQKTSKYNEKMQSVYQGTFIKQEHKQEYDNDQIRHIKTQFPLPFDQISTYAGDFQRNPPYEVYKIKPPKFTSFPSNQRFSGETQYNKEINKKGGNKFPKGQVRPLPLTLSVELKHRQDTKLESKPTEFQYNLSSHYDDRFKDYQIKGTNNPKKYRGHYHEVLICGVFYDYPSLMKESRPALLPSSTPQKPEYGKDIKTVSSSKLHINSNRLLDLLRKTKRRK